MEKDLLSEVIEVEKEIQTCLEQEKVKSREWLEQTRREFEKELVLGEKDVAASLERSIEVAKRDAELRASDVVKKAALTAERLATIKNETLQRIVNKHLNRILPG